MATSSTARARATTRTTLKPREARFVAEFLKDQVGKAAAIRAGYSERSADKIAHELLQRPVVKRAVAKGLEEQLARVLLNADQVLLSIQRVGHKAEKDKEYAAALRAYELIGKRYKLFTDKLEVVDTTPRAERLRAARARKQSTGE